jgi:ribonucleotide reductase alpha subunit
METQPLRILVKVSGRPATHTTDVAHIDPEYQSSLSLASEIAETVGFYTNKRSIELGRERGTPQEADKDDIACYIDGYTNDILAFARDASSQSITLNMSVLNTNGTKDDIYIDVTRATEYRNP